MRCALGIDTSCYTTSVALAGEQGVAASRRRLLEVERGARGLRQSEALFEHVNRLPQLFEELLADCPEARVEAVCASARPREVEGSYMPVFVGGLSFAKCIAAALRVPLFETSHQQGHVRAAMVGAGEFAGEFIAVHASGGTTEALRVGEGLRIEKLCGSQDLHAGQLVDRVGVKMGLAFPAGSRLEELAVRGDAHGAMPLAHRGGDVSFSGAEAQAMRMLESGARREDVAAEVYSYLARALARMIAAACAHTGLETVLLSGGVASSLLLRKLLPARLERLGCAVSVRWGRPELSGDNACGVALIGWEEYEHGLHH